LATIKDIARLTGVSAATVSNVLNGKPGAAGPEKTQEIFDTAKLLNYHPNYLAKNLKLRRSKAVGIITEDLTVHHTPEIVNGIEEYCERCGYEILLANLRLFKRYGNDFGNSHMHTALFESAMSSLMSKQIEGIIYIGYHCREVPCCPPDPDLPFVYAYCIPPGRQYPYVLFDDEGAGREVGRALLSRGHRNIGLITGPVSSMNSMARLRGFQRALYEASVPYNVSTTISGDWSSEAGYAGAEALLSNDITAIFAFNDLMASGAFACCIDHKVSVGRDISLFGYDNLNIVDAYIPSISSVEPPLNELGRKSAELVLSMIQGESVPNERYTLPCKVHVRGSVVNIDNR